MEAPGPQQTVGICCRIWLPDAVLPAGQSLRAALEGINGSNFAHLRSKYPSAEFKVFGAASLALPQAQRLHVAARCRDAHLLEQLEVDVIDLAETACDIVADTLGLSDEQVQDAFEKIRVEKHDTYFSPVAVGTAVPKGMADDDEENSIAGAQSKAKPVVRPSAPVGVPPVTAPLLPPPPGPLTPPPGLGGPPLPPLSTAPSSTAWLAPPPVLQAPPVLQPPPPAGMTVPLLAAAPPVAAAVPVAVAAPPVAPVVAAAAPVGTLPAAAAVATPVAPAAPGAAPWALPAQRTAVAPPTSENSAALPPVAQPLAPPQRSADAEADQPEAKRQRTLEAGSIEAAVAAASSVATPTPAVGEPMGPPPPPTARRSKGPPGGGAVPAAGGGEAVPASGAATPGAGPLVSKPERCRVKLYKLGDFCCDVVATFSGGNVDHAKLEATMHIDQRAKVDRCREHMQWAGKLATVWRLLPAHTEGKEAYTALCDYFIDKGRVGFVETKWFAVYIVPPGFAQQYLADVSDAMAAASQSKRLLGLQVPTAVG